ncbi:FAD-dependent oxidoreductase [Nakamurella antarctica]|uniref:FAD-dependent oxidoreductase n=1 Tax=Nakamurella antarctica TaxID=1902245 RepID=A0A3G8ZXJ6_9ACTN|nr:FAD-dependent oxidoreductase [Nakamurella antarctica]AZI58371.1 FAD-dependent oxidoreductase [Nakamurella antarctica]
MTAPQTSQNWKSDDPTPPRAGWDLVVIGGGTAGLVAARTAASLGATVMLVERDRPGGDCLWTGCVPSKALIAAAAQVSGRATSEGRGSLALRSCPHMSISVR